jgi:hypothetical protein
MNRQKVYKTKLLVCIALILAWSRCGFAIPAYTFGELNNVAFINDSDKPVYVYSDKEFQVEVPPKGAQCLGIEFFKGTGTKPTFRYFKLYHQKPVTFTEEPLLKKVLAPNKNYRVTTQAILPIEEKWPKGCPLSLSKNEQGLGALFLAGDNFPEKGIFYTATLNPYRYANPDGNTGSITIRNQDGKQASFFYTSVPVPHPSPTIENKKMWITSQIREGGKVQTFDVSNPEKPKLLSTENLPEESPEEKANTEKRRQRERDAMMGPFSRIKSKTE